MRRIVGWAAATAVALVLLLSFPTSHAPSGGATVVVTSSGTGGGPTSGPSSGPSSGTGSTTSTQTTITGTAVRTRYGPVQVQVVVRDGRMVSAVAVAYATQGRDGEINSYAIPVLEQEAVAQQSAHVDTVSGATYTSEGYRESLQSALDLAHL